MNKILIINHHANAPDCGGGGRHFDISKELSKKGYQVEILASSFDHFKGNYIKSNKIDVTQVYKNVHIKRYKSKPRYSSNLGRFINYFHFMKMSSKYQSDVKIKTVIASSVHPLVWISGYKIAKRYNAKFIVEVRDLWPLSLYEDLDGLTRRIVFHLFEYLEKKYYNLADAIVTTAPFAYEYMEEKYNINKRKVYHIPHGIDLNKFEKNVKRDCMVPNSIVNILDKGYCVTYTGALSKSEGLETLVKSAIYLNDNINILIIGSGSEKNKLENLINLYNLKNVHMFPAVARDIVPQILIKSDALFTGLMDRKVFEYGISKNKFYDYMASSKPIIFASNVRASLVDKANAGITIRPNDAKLLAKTIDNLYYDQKNSKRYGYQGRKFVQENHTTEIIGEKFIDVLKKVERGI